MEGTTRGKWRHVKGSGGVDYIMAGDVRIATMTPPLTTAGRITEREAFRNGETIAASSTLLVACRAMRRFLIGEHGHDKGPEMSRPDNWPKCLVYADIALAQVNERLDWPEEGD